MDDKFHLCFKYCYELWQSISKRIVEFFLPLPNKTQFQLLSPKKKKKNPIKAFQTCKQKGSVFESRENTVHH